jgi:very-short-patch-repair endonuclease
MSKISKSAWENPEYRKKMLEVVRKLFQDLENKKKMSEIMKSKWQDPEFRERTLAVVRSEEHRKKLSEVIKSKWQDPEYREKSIRRRSEVMRKRWQNLEFRKMKSEVLKSKWQAPEYREKIVRRVMEALEIRPNGLEKAFCEILQNYFINEWMYVGDGKVVIKGFVPDFVHKEENWIIELNRDFWHNLPMVKKRDKIKRKVYKEEGYKVLEVWESEIGSDLMAVVDKVAKYFYGEN